MRKIMMGAAAAAMGLWAAAAGAVTADFTVTLGQSSVSSNTPATGASTAIGFTFAQDGAAADNRVLVTLSIANTTGSPVFGAGATQGNLTGIGFDLFGASSYLANSFVAGAKLDTLFASGTTLNPFPAVEFAVGDNTNFEGGTPSGLLAGQSDTVKFKLSTAIAAATLSDNFKAGFTNGSLGVIARFMAVNAGSGSDKLSGGVVTTPGGGLAPVPLPAAGWMLLAGVGALGAIRLRGRAGV
jgi:hypothetical protein